MIKKYATLTTGATEEEKQFNFSLLPYGVTEFHIRFGQDVSGVFSTGDVAIHGNSGLMTYDSFSDTGVFFGGYKENGSTKLLVYMKGDGKASLFYAGGTAEVYSLISNNLTNSTLDSTGINSVEFSYTGVQDIDPQLNIAVNTDILF